MTTRDEIKHIASEIVRGMTNAYLDEDQRTALRFVAENVMNNHLIYKKKIAAGKANHDEGRVVSHKDAKKRLANMKEKISKKKK